MMVRVGLCFAREHTLTVRIDLDRMGGGEDRGCYAAEKGNRERAYAVTLLPDRRPSLLKSERVMQGNGVESRMKAHEVHTHTAPYIHMHANVGMYIHIHTCIIHVRCAAL